jgi:coenzyme PQQ precursor peptide PqqA
MFYCGNLATDLGALIMTWKTPKIVEVKVGMEINMYAYAAHK